MEAGDSGVASRGAPGAASGELAIETDALTLCRGEAEGRITGGCLSLLVATLGTPQDVTLQEIRIESFFPGDQETERFFRDRN